MPDFEKASELALPASSVWRFHALPGAFQRLMPPWQSLLIRSWTGTLADARLEFAIRQGPIKLTWLAQHDPAAFVDGRQFVDVMLKGPASRWRHTHLVDSRGDGRCLLHDRIAYALPLHPLSDVIAGAKFRSDLDRLFAFRHARTMLDTWRHNRFASHGPKHIVLTGSNGVIGSALLAYLINAGHRVDRLVRSEPRATGDGTALLPGREIRWDPAATEPSESLIRAIDGCDAVVHLSGAGLAARRWTPAVKRDLVTSRVDATKLLARALTRCTHPPGAFIVASGVNYYPPAAHGDITPRDESAPAGSTFLARLAADWELAAAEAAGTCRVASLRLGVVLTTAGGFLRGVRPGLIPMGASRLGSADAIVPWLHIDDTLAAIEHAIHTPSITGPINVAAPAVDSHKAVMAAINQAAGAWATLPVPHRALRLLAGEVADHAFASQPISSAKLQSTGFTFAVTSIQTAAGIEFGSLPSLVRHAETVSELIRASQHPHPAPR